MKTLKQTSVIIAAIVLFSSAVFAQSSAKLTKEGAAFETNGMYVNAAESYYDALDKKPDNVKALVGLNRSALIVMQEKLDALDYSYSIMDYDDVIYKYENALIYRCRMREKQVSLEVGPRYTEYYNNSKQTLADKYYLSGKRYLEIRNYSNAIDDLGKCLKYVSSYKDAASLLSQAKNAKDIEDAERYYNSGVTNYASGDYHGAYYDFDNCLKYVSNYKDAYALKNKSLEKGKIRIAILEYKNGIRAYDSQSTLYSYVVTNIVSKQVQGTQSPFLEVLDRDNLEALYNEIRISGSGSVDVSGITKAGKILGVDYVVMVGLVNVTSEGGNLVAQPFNAFELYAYNNSEGKTIFAGKPVTFNVYEGKSTATFEAKYQIISVETSQIVGDNIISGSDNDYVKFARYGGDPSLLCLINPEPTTVGQILILASMVNQKLFTARQELKTPAEMQTPILKDLASRMASNICYKFN